MSRPVLVTAGATRNPLDRMRYISAGSSGRTGVAIARTLSAAHPVHVLGSPEAALRAADLSVEVYGSTRDLMARMEAWVRAHPGGVVIHAAAVGDYEAAPETGKVESGRAEWVIRLTPTPKIADRLKDWGPALGLVTFKAAAPGTATPALLEIARRQLERTRSDLVFANVLDHLDRDVALVEPDGERVFSTREEAVAALLGHPLFGA